MAPIRERSSSKSKSRSLSRKSLHDASEIETFGLRNVNSSTNTSLSKRAGLVMPVPAILKKLKKEKYAKKIQKGAGVYCTSVIEYLVAELLDMAGDAAKDNKKKRISPRHISLAVRSDSELSTLLSKVTIAEGGVLPYIQQCLLKLASNRKKADKTVQQNSPSPKKPSFVRRSENAMSTEVLDSDSD